MRLVGMCEEETSSSFIVLLLSVPALSPGPSRRTYTWPGNRYSAFHGRYKHRILATRFQKIAHISHGKCTSTIGTQADGRGVHPLLASIKRFGTLLTTMPWYLPVFSAPAQAVRRKRLLKGYSAGMSNIQRRLHNDLMLWFPRYAVLCAVSIDGTAYSFLITLLILSLSCSLT